MVWKGRAFEKGVQSGDGGGCDGLERDRGRIRGIFLVLDDTLGYI